MGFQVIIAGGRDFANYELLQNKCDQFFREKRPTAIISGPARGADTLGTHYARERGIQVLEFPADWERLGRRAGMVRNLQMLDAADAVVAFWDGQSRGTAHTIGEAKKKRTAPAGSPVLERRLIEKWQRGNNTHPWSSMRKSWAR